MEKRKNREIGDETGQIAQALGSNKKKPYSNVDFRPSII